jgi:hypothetical protein
VNPATGPKAIGPGHHVLKSPKLWAKINLVLI